MVKWNNIKLNMRSCTIVDKPPGPPWVKTPGVTRRSQVTRLKWVKTHLKPYLESVLLSFLGSAWERSIEALPLVANGARSELKPTVHLV